MQQKITIPQRLQGICKYYVYIMCIIYFSRKMRAEMTNGRKVLLRKTVLLCNLANKRFQVDPTAQIDM